MRNFIFLTLTLLLWSTNIQCQLNSSLFTQCGVTKTCLSSIPGSSCSCTPADCKLLITIENVPAEERILFGLYSDGDYSYMAIGISNDQNMYDSDVFGCQKFDASTAHVKDTYNPEFPTRDNTNDNDDSGIANFSFSIVGNAFSCVFTRTYIPPDATKGFVLNATTYYLFSATQDGGAFRPQNAGFLQHTTTPCVSDTVVDLLGSALISSSSPDYSLVRAHGMLMLLAWSVFISTGVFLASYTKSTFPNGEWFHVHKFINIFAVLTALVGLILIFVSLGEWKIGPPGEGATLWAHQIIGLLSILLMLTNPIVAAFRCRPTAKFRWIFNSIHKGIGFVAMTLAAVAISLGLFLYYELIGKSITAAPGFWIYIVRLLTEPFFHISLIIYLCIRCKKCEGDEKDAKKDTPLPEVNPIKLFLLNIFAPPKCVLGEDRKKPAGNWPIIVAVLIGFVVYNLVFYFATVIAVAISEDV